MIISIPGILANRTDSIDPDVRAFLNATGISSSTIRNALNVFVIDLKANNLWSKFHAIYPFVGGTAFTHKFNLKNSLDTNAAFRLLFAGGWTHNSNGITGNAINTYANTYYTENVNSTAIGNKHISVYCKTLSTDLQVEMGATGSVSVATDTTDIVTSTNTGGFNCFMRNSSTSGGFPNAISTGFFLNNRTSATQIRAFKDSTLNIIASNSTNLVTYPYYIGATNVANSSIGFVSSRNIAFSSIGESFTDGEAVILYGLIQTLQTSLSRAV